MTEGRSGGHAGVGSGLFLLFLCNFGELVGKPRKGRGEARFLVAIFEVLWQNGEVHSVYGVDAPCASAVLP